MSAEFLVNLSIWFTILQESFKVLGLMVGILAGVALTARLFRWR